MNKKDLYQAFGDMDNDILERSEAPVRHQKTPPRIKWGALAACLVLAISLFGATFVAEAKEYNAAVEFFAANGLSMDGLSRSDIKAVYRDITAQHFTCDKTVEVLELSMPGLEISQREPTPEELAALWDWNVWRNTQPGAGISYRTDSQYRLDKALGFDVFDKSILECYQDGDLLWTVEFSSFYVEQSVSASAGTMVWGYTPTWSSEQPTCSCVARVDSTGKILWERQLDHGFKYEYVSQVLDNKDGTWAVISRGDFEYLCLSQYDADGNELSFRKTEVGNLGIWNVAPLGDGYLVQLGNIIDGETARMVKLDRNGSITDNFTYESEDCDYYLTDMIEFGGRVWLSAYAVPKQTDDGGRHEIANILAYIFDGENWEISSEELTPLVRDNYTAVLLLCDAGGGQPRAFYSVKGSLGDELDVDDTGNLVWDVQSVTSTFFSPATSSFTIGGTSQIFRYTFSTVGTLLDQKDTGETVPYRR